MTNLVLALLLSAVDVQATNGQRLSIAWDFPMAQESSITGFRLRRAKSVTGSYAVMSSIPATSRVTEIECVLPATSKVQTWHLFLEAVSNTWYSPGSGHVRVRISR